MNTELLDAEESREVEGGGIIATLSKSEIDMQVATAKKYPRSLKRFVDETTQMVTLSEEVASECLYSIKRQGTVIQGPSARFAEVIASAWGNCRCGARIVDEDDKFVTAQGAFYDLQRNVAVTVEVRRRVTTKDGRKFGDDMVGVTSNAACSIALRNAVLKGVPKAFWATLYETAKKTAVGSAETLQERRQKMVAHFARMGVSEAQICKACEVEGVADIGLDNLAMLKGIATAIMNNEQSVDEAFGEDEAVTAKKKKAPPLAPKQEAKPSPLDDAFAHCKDAAAVEETVFDLSGTADATALAEAKERALARVRGGK